MARDRATRVAYCPHCSNRTPQVLVHSQQFRTTAYRDDGAEPKEVGGCVGEQFVAACQTCDQLLVYEDYQPRAESLAFIRAELAWPEPDELHHAVPEPVQTIYDEAVRIRAHAPNAYATQIRRALEAICEDRGARKGTLQRRLQELASRGEIPPLLAELTDVLRLLGNMGAHEIDQRVRPFHVDAIHDFFRAVVEYVYVAPYKLNEFRSRLAAIEHRKNAPHATDEALQQTSVLW